MPAQLTERDDCYPEIQLYFFNNFILIFLLRILSGLIAFWFWLVRVMVY